MRIIFNEIKHIFNWKTVLLLMLFTGAFYFLFISFHVQGSEKGIFEKGTTADYDYKIAASMIKSYGHSMDAKEFGDFKRIYNQKVKIADRYLQSHSEFKKVGITTYKAFEKMDASKKPYSSLNNKVMFKDNVSIFWELQERSGIISNYKYACIDNPKNGYVDNTYSKAQEARIAQIVSDDRLTSIFPFDVFDDYNTIIVYEAALVILCIMFALGPIFLRDRRNNVNYMQYSSKMGRRIFKKKIVASFIAAFMIITVQLLFLFVLYSRDNTGMFFDSKIMSFFNGPYFWYDLTFFQYIIVTVVATYLMGFCAALITLFASRLALNHFALIGMLIPVAFVFINVMPPYMLREFATISLPQFLTPTAYAILAVIATALPIILWRREKKLDVCN